MASRRKVALSDYEMTTTLGTGKDKELIIKSSIIIFKKRFQGLSKDKVKKYLEFFKKYNILTNQYE